MRLEYFVVAEGVSIDQTTNQVSVFNILEQVRTHQFPAGLSAAAALVLWLAEPDDVGKEFQNLLRLTFPDNSIHDFATNFTPGPKRHRVTQRFLGLPLSGPGTLKFEVLLNGVPKASHTIDVEQSDSLFPAPSPPQAN